MNYRVKCAACGEVLNVGAACSCPKCGAAVTPEQPGMLKLYRMGNFVGVAVGFGIYLNDRPMGHIGNKETVCIPLPYGNYKLHMTAGMSRKCRDLEFTVSPEDPYICAKVHLKMGFISNTVVPERVAPSEMPE